MIALLFLKLINNENWKFSLGLGYNIKNNWTTIYV